MGGRGVNRDFFSLSFRSRKSLRLSRDLILTAREGRIEAKSEKMEGAGGQFAKTCPFPLLLLLRDFAQLWSARGARKDSILHLYL